MHRIFAGVCLLVVIVSLSSCGHFERDRQYAAYYKILAANDTLDLLTREWYTILNSAIRNRSYAGLNPQRLKMGEYMNRKRDEIANLDMPGDLVPIVDSESVLLAVRATIISELYPKFESFNELTPNETIKGQLKSLYNDQGSLAIGSAVITRSLKAYMHRNGLRITGSMPEESTKKKRK